MTFDLRIAEHTFAGPAPLALKDLLQTGLDLFLPPMVKGRLVGTHALFVGTVKGHHMILQGAPPCPLPELLRTLTRQTSATAALLVHNLPVVPPEVDHERAWSIEAESMEGRLQVLVGMSGDPDSPQGVFQVFQGPKRPGAPPKWVGVAPTVEVELFPLQAARGWTGPTEGES